MEAGWSSVRLWGGGSHILARLVLWTLCLSQKASGVITSQSSGAASTNLQRWTLATEPRTKISFQHLLGSMDSVQKENVVYPGAYKNLVAGPRGWWVHCVCSCFWFMSKRWSVKTPLLRAACYCKLSNSAPISILENIFFFNASEDSSELTTNKQETCHSVAAFSSSTTCC